MLARGRGGTGGAGDGARVSEAERLGSGAGPDLRGLRRAALGLVGESGLAVRKSVGSCAWGAEAKKEVDATGWAQGGGLSGAWVSLGERVAMEESESPD